MYTIYQIPDVNNYFGFIRMIEEEIYPLASVTGLKKINIFIGANNSGKSRFLRKMFLTSNKKSFIEFNEGMNQWIISNEGDLHQRFNIFYNGNSHRELSDYSQSAMDFLDKYYIVNVKPKNQNHNPIKSLSDGIQALLNQERVGKPINIFLKERIYVPLLRGLNPICIDDEGNYSYQTDVYAKRILKQYFSSKNTSSVDIKEIFTGQTIYIQLKDMLLGDHNDREKVKKYEQFLSHNIFGDKEVTLIPKIHSDTLTVKIGKEDEREIHDLGDGIQSLILLTFPIFMNSEKEMVFFFEEPEINMHPGMQRVFLKALLNCGFEKHQYFFTTHSNHFIDIAFDYSNISLYMFKKFRYKEVELEKTGYLIERVEAGNVDILKQLGVNNSSVFLSNCTIWVEGITDKLILNEYINKQLKEDKLDGKFIENLHYSFVEYGGSSISHLTCINENLKSDEIYIKGISNKPVIIADFDREGKHLQRHKRLGDSYFYVKEAKEIENTLSENVLKRVIADYEGISNFNQLEFKNNFTYEDYKQAPLGAFIDDQLGKKKKREGSYTDGNTISDKLGFAKRVCKILSDNNITYEESMSQSAIVLAKKLVNFIIESNKDIESI